MDYEDDLIQLNSEEIMAPIKPSNSTRTVDSGYGSMLRDDEILGAYPPGGSGVGTSGSSEAEMKAVTVSSTRKCMSGCGKSMAMTFFLST